MTDSMLSTLAALLIAWLFAGTLITLAFGRQLGRAAHWPVWIATAIALVFSVALTVGLADKVQTARQADDANQSYRVLAFTHDWVPTGVGDPIRFAMYIDPLTCIMLLTITVVGLPIAIYSRGYMTGDPGYARYFFAVGLFLLGMSVLVLAGNFLVLFLGWEAVGLCSYLLIGHYGTKPAARAAAFKAFVVNRIGDLGLLIGIFLIYSAVGSLEFDRVLTPATARMLHEQGLLTPICLLLFVGCIGKSAQFPLYLWLPDAMEGPSPVSALIHAATMVTAGVYLVARCGVLFCFNGDHGYHGMSTAMSVVTVVGAASALYAALCACAQFDMKRILAYSTMSQLGFMFVALGVGRADSAIFHLHTHAFFKALLFLSAGAVMHAMHHVIDIRQLGGLKKRLPLVYVAMLIGALALAGAPFLSGFFSKDEIIHAAWSASPATGAVLLLIALLTAFYTFRMVFWAFEGKEKLPAEVMHHGQPQIHKPTPTMAFALVYLIIGSAGIGYIGTTFLGEHQLLGGIVPFSPGAESIAHGDTDHAAPLHGFLFGSITISQLEMHGGKGVDLFATVLFIIGLVAAYLFYVGDRSWADAIYNRVPRLHALLANSFYYDYGAQRLVVEPAATLGAVADVNDRNVVSGAVEATAFAPRVLGYVLRPLQTGRLQGYAVVMMAGLVLVITLALAVDSRDRPLANPSPDVPGVARPGVVQPVAGH